MSSKSTIYSIQSLRGVAALMVVIAHSQVYLHARNYIDNINPLLDIGRAGVDVFFVISGFIMIYVAGDKFGKPGASRDFFIRRIIRIVPLYWFYTLLLTTLLIFLPQYFSQGKVFDGSHFFASMLFVPWENTIGLDKPVLMVGWTLNYEMYFYLIFAALLFFPKERFLFLISVFMLLSVLTGVLFKVDQAIYTMITSPQLLEFLMGCVIGAVFFNGVRFKTSTCFLLILVGLTAIYLSIIYNIEGLSRLFKWGLPTAFVITGLIFLERNNIYLLGRKFLVRIGDSSYSLYLSHIFTVNALGKIWFMNIEGYFSLFIVLSFFLSAVIGFAAYHLLEKPMVRYFSDIYHGRCQKTIAHESS